MLEWPHRSTKPRLVGKKLRRLHQSKPYLEVKAVRSAALVEKIVELSRHWSEGEN